MTDTRACAAYELDYSALIDGELSPAREALVQTHVASCEPCCAQLAGLQRVDRALGELSRPDLPADLRARLQARIEPCAAPRAGRRAPPARRRWRSLPAAAAAAAVAAAALAFLYLVPSEPKSPGSAPVIIARATPASADPATTAAPGGATSASQDAAAELGLESVEDLDVIANLELLEAFVALDGGTG